MRKLALFLLPAAVTLMAGGCAVVELEQVEREEPVKEDDVPRVRVMIPKSIDSESGLKSDPYEHVTINGALPYYIRKGEYVDVPVPVFLQLRNKYPNI